MSCQTRRTLLSVLAAFVVSFVAINAFACGERPGDTKTIDISGQITNCGAGQMEAGGTLTSDGSTWTGTITISGPWGEDCTSEVKISGPNGSVSLGTGDAHSIDCSASVSSCNGVGTPATLTIYVTCPPAGPVDVGHQKM